MKCAYCAWSLYAATSSLLLLSPAEAWTSQLPPRVSEIQSIQNKSMERYSKLQNSWRLYADTVSTMELTAESSRGEDNEYDSEEYDGDQGIVAMKIDRTPVSKGDDKQNYGAIESSKDESTRPPSGSNKLGLLAFYSANLAAVAVAAKIGFLDGPNMIYDSITSYSNFSILRDAGSSVVAAALAVVFVKAVQLLNERFDVPTKVTRKLVHTLTAPLFILVWPLFSDVEGARFFAGVVSLTNMLRLYLAGNNPTSSLAQTVSRSGNSSEALGGPFVYVAILHLAIWTFWRSSPIGVVALSTMAAGDGMADLVGRRWGQNSQWDAVMGWDFAKGKSIVGTTAFSVAASLSSIGLLAWLSFWNCLSLPEALSWADVAIRVVGISTICSFIELLPIGDDNYTVPFGAALLAALLLT